MSKSPHTIELEAEYLKGKEAGIRRLKMPENKGLLAEIKEVLRLDVSVADKPHTTIDEDYPHGYMREEDVEVLSQEVLAKVRKAVKGAGLTVPELVEVRSRYNNLILYLPLYEVKELRWNSYLAEAQLQAILKAIDKEIK